MPGPFETGYYRREGAESRPPAHNPWNYVCQCGQVGCRDSSGKPVQGTSTPAARKPWWRRRSK